MSDQFKYPILAKPSGITLDQHRRDVISEGKLLSTFYPFTFKKYNELTGKSLARRLEIVSDFHDDGKDDQSTTNKWQKACQTDYENFLRWQEKHRGSFWNYAQARPHEVGAFLRKANVRHEFQSLVRHEKRKLPICLQAAIAAHHGKLGFSSEDRWLREGVQRFWKAFQKESNRVIDENMSIAEIAKLHYEFAGPRSLLQLVDHRASAIEDNDVIPNHTPFSYTFPHAEKRNVQKLVEQYWQDDLLLLRAATGAGKTDASLLWALKQIENNRAERLVIAMPTRFTSNALAINVAESLSDTGLYHSSAWLNKFQAKVESGVKTKRTALGEHGFARLLQTPVTVCTIDHLLMALTLTREDHHLITFNLAHSCLVIDEADFYDDFTQANILVLLEILKHWKVPVLLMSASLPQCVLPKYQKIGFPVTDIKEDNIDVEEYKRPRFEIKSIRACTTPSDINDLLFLALEKGNAIIYANTVERSLEFKKWFEDKHITTCLYHGRFTEPDKIEKEKQLIGMLGLDAWRNGTAYGIAILTQIGEMSVNISSELMISELCPIDRLTQRAGRLCRFGKNVGKLYILIPEKKGSIYPAPYGVYDQKTRSWVGSEVFERTRNIISCEEYSVEKLVFILNEVYKSELEFSIPAQTNAKTLKEYFRSNWLINSKQISRKEDSAVNFWQSRNILPQERVFVSKPETMFFTNYLSFQDWKIKTSLEIPTYLVQKAQRKHLVEIEKVMVKDDKETLFFVKEGYYTFEKGIDFKLPDVIL